jgi:hypothetical protein
MLAIAALPLVGKCREGLAAVTTWIIICNKARHHKVKEDYSVDDATAALQSALDDFHIARLAAIKPYGHCFDPAHPPSEEIDYKKVRTSVKSVSQSS